MIMESIDYDKLLEEVLFSFSRSSGKGGQHVNKVETKAELYFNIPNSLVLSQSAKDILLNVLKSKIDNEGTLRIVSASQRSQLANRKKAQELFIKTISNALKPKKKRLATKPSKQAKLSRLESKKKQGEKKKLRKVEF